MSAITNLFRFTALLLLATPLWAHDPIFGMGPHVLYKGGLEISPLVDRGERRDAEQTEAGLELVYGLSGKWSAGIKLPYSWRQVGSQRSSGRADIEIFSKYRFWRKDRLGIQESAAVLLKVDTNSADGSTRPPQGSGGTDTVMGLAYGYESRKWYRWASLRYRWNGRGTTGTRRGDKLLFDLVGGVRPQQTGYLQADTVWMLELNGEYTRDARLTSGGTEWFLSPGIFWTLRNFAVKAGVQIPVYSALPGDIQSDYRVRLVLEWHL